MRFITKLFVFAVVLTGVLGVYKIGQAFRGDRHERVIVSEAPEAPEAPEPPEPPEVPLAPSTPVTSVSLARDDAHQVRIFTNNRAAFLSLRDNNLVAGLSDSLREHVDSAMKRGMENESHGNVGAMIEDVVRSSVNKLMQKEIVVPVSEIRDIEYRDKRIVVRYKHGDGPGLIKLEQLKGDNDRTLLEQFNEADARRLVAAVKTLIR
ncbi:MAG: hypothetical protein IT361_04140 [Gemmatimonadaceae bacterium]|nr:hypothetical protein [Gemmatimonadaceae bacterium]